MVEVNWYQKVDSIKFEYVSAALLSQGSFNISYMVKVKQKFEKFITIFTRKAIINE